MSTVTPSRKNKHFQLDQARLKKDQKLLGARTETETVKVALERIISEAENVERARAAQNKFLQTAIKEN